MTEIKAGDVVTLIHDTSEMTVESIQEDGKAVCIYWSKGELKRDMINKEALQVVDYSQGSSKNFFI